MSRGERETQRRDHRPNCPLKVQTQRRDHRPNCPLKVQTQRRDHRPNCPLKVQTQRRDHRPNCPLKVQTQRRDHRPNCPLKVQTQRRDHRPNCPLKVQTQRRDHRPNCPLKVQTQRRDHRPNCPLKVQSSPVQETAKPAADKSYNLLELRPQVKELVVDVVLIPPFLPGLSTPHRTNSPVKPPFKGSPLMLQVLHYLFYLHCSTAGPRLWAILYRAGWPGQLRGEAALIIIMVLWRAGGKQSLVKREQVIGDRLFFSGGGETLR